jgi:hypothetical protein
MQAHDPLLPRSPTLAHLMDPGTPKQYLIVVLGHPSAMRPVVRTSSTLACGQSLLRFGTRERTVANVLTVAPFEVPSAVE